MLKVRRLKEDGDDRVENHSIFFLDCILSEHIIECIEYICEYEECEIVFDVCRLEQASMCFAGKWMACLDTKYNDVHDNYEAPFTKMLLTSLCADRSASAFRITRL